MSQLILESANALDLQLLLSLAKRLDVKVVSIRENMDTKSDKMALMCQAANDPLFQKDVEKVMEDFKHIDSELYE
ncbi:MAG: hypothetical protein AAGG68_14910 [Bacteroidota bacterium]